MTRMDRTHDQLAVLFLDVDNFKVVNDTLGHSAGTASCRRRPRSSWGACASQTPRRGSAATSRDRGEEIGDRYEVVKLVERILDRGTAPLCRRRSGGDHDGQHRHHVLPARRLQRRAAAADADEAMCTRGRGTGRNRYAEFEDGMSGGSVAAS